MRQATKDDEDLMGDAIRRAYRVQSRMPERFEELLRRLSEKEAEPPQKR